MDYLAILKNLDAGKADARETAAAVAQPSNELNELNEKSPVSASLATEPEPSPAESALDPIWDPPLGRRNDQSEMVLSVADMPELERRLRLSGWRVERVTGKYGPELRCWMGRKPRFQ